MNDAIVNALEPISEVRTFKPGHVLRMQGGFAPEMLLILEGKVDIDIAPGATKKLRHTIGEHAILGEIGFLSGKGATADAKAATPIRALAINREVLTNLEVTAPALAADFSRQLARTTMTRLQMNKAFLADVADEAVENLEIVMCSRANLLRQAQRLRYDVNCGEFGRPSPYARHDEKRITDALDERGTSFVALKDTNPIATARVNFTRNASLGMLPSIYGLSKSEYFPDHTCLITKQAIRGDFRSGTIYIRLFGAMMTFIMQSDVHEIYIDCVPEIIHIYEAIGFKQCAEEFVDYDNGLSVPMKLDAVGYTSQMPIEHRHRQGKWAW